MSNANDHEYDDWLSEMDADEQAVYDEAMESHVKAFPIDEEESVSEAEFLAEKRGDCGSEEAYQAWLYDWKRSRMTDDERMKFDDAEREYYLAPPVGCACPDGTPYYGCTCGAAVEQERREG